ncbi:MAG: hypothetical protein RL026_932 [Pseudomonadota bacterium]|jgi:aminoglycoside/choline kinase family phosphotransferase
MHADLRLQLIHDWLHLDLGWSGFSVVPASADASFRRYFRVSHQGRSHIVMDAPPDKEDVRPYLAVSDLLAGAGVHVPEVQARDTARGLLLLEDLGHTHLLTALQAGGDPDALYTDALVALAGLQCRGAAVAAQLPPYDAAVLRREMQLLPDWYLARHLQQPLTAAEQSLWEDTQALLLREIEAQPRVFVHRDYHSRNLMVTGERSPGVIDFQDALHGPAAYDLASLLKDCYVAWPRARLEAWVAQFRALLQEQGPHGAALAGPDLATHLRWLDMVGLQRHLKVLGIFARLFWRDGKPGYLDDLPRTLAYVREAAGLHPELAAFRDFVDTRLAPGLEAANARARAAAVS